MSEPLSWSYRAAEIAEAGLRERRTATAEELVEIARVLDVLSCESVTAEYVIRPIGRGHYRLKGEVSAQLTQACVVTLEPISQRLDAAFDVEFWPAGTLPVVGEEEVEVLASAEIEPIEHGRIDAGRIVFETLSASLDPYPRKPGVAFAGETTDSLEAGKESPFAALKTLKDQT